MRQSRLAYQVRREQSLESTLTSSKAAILAILFCAVSAPAALAQQDHHDDLRSGVQRMGFLKGKWQACFVNAAEDGWRKTGEARTIEFRTDMNDLYLTAETANAQYRYQMLFSYDELQKRYRIASHDDQSGLLDIYQGQFEKNGALIVTNLESGTHYAVDGVDYYNRLSFKQESKGWISTVEVTADKGISWRPQLRIVASPATNEKRGETCSEH